MGRRASVYAATPARRQEILDAALGCFTEHGIEATTIEQIRAAAGCSIGSLYHHFKSKEGVWRALFIQGISRLNADLIARLGTCASAEEGVRTVVSQYCDWVSAHPELARFLFHSRDIMSSSEARGQLRRVHREHLREVFMWFAPFVQRGEMKQLPVDTYVPIISGPIQDYVRQWLSGQLVALPCEVKDVFADAAWNGVRGERRHTMAIATDEHPKQKVEVLGKQMAYVEMGEGRPVVFLHGNPTSSYLWRNVMPHVRHLGRCIAPDLIGMGDSDKLDDAARYTFVEHRAFVDGFLDAVGVDRDVVLVIHDWGSALGFDWANRRRERVRGLCYMEAIVRPVTWEEWPQAARGVFEGFRSDAGEDMVLNRNIFVERVLPGSVLRGLTDQEMAVYRRPFQNTGEDRRPTLTWPRQIPIDGEPRDVVEIVGTYAEWLRESAVPKLFINADPGAILTGAQREFCRAWPNQTEVTVKGSHFIQEDSPNEIGEALAAWLQTLP